ncbi:MAG: amidohydrolase family protein [Acidimicrobiia bacterium]
MDIPRIISVDDHVIEPPDVWTKRLPAEFADRAPRMERVVGGTRKTKRTLVFKVGGGDEVADCWLYEGTYYPIVSGLVASGQNRDKLTNAAVTIEEMLPACYDQAARLEAMDRNHTDASLCFPTFPRFCGQTFLEAQDKDLALACVRAYNDWMIDEWCGGAGRGRLIPLTLIPLWDVELAVAEVYRCAAKGSYAIAFSESPPSLDLPSIHSGYWDPLWAACQETGTSVNMHIGSSSTFPSTGPDSPMLTSTALVHEGSHRALVDWLCSGVLGRYPELRIALSEGQVGWIPFVLERLDYNFETHKGYARGSLTELPSTHYKNRVFGCVVDDRTGLRMRDVVGMDQMMYEVDFPHGDSPWPNNKQMLEKLAHDSGLNDEELYKLARGNAINFYRLREYGITV